MTRRWGVVILVLGCAHESPTRAALSPDGRRLAAEGADFTITDVYSPSGVLLFSDTTVSAATDLWSFEVP